MALIEVCKITEMPSGAVRQIKFDGRDPICIYHLDDGFYAIDDICTHARAMLSMGDIDGGTIACPFHAGSFDIRTGAAVAWPCIVPLRTYDVTIEDDVVWVDLGEEV